MKKKFESSVCQGRNNGLVQFCYSKAKLSEAWCEVRS